MYTKGHSLISVYGSVVMASKDNNLITSAEVRARMRDQIPMKSGGSRWRHQTFSALPALCAGGSPVYSPHKGQWRGALMCSLVGARTNSWANNGDASDLRCHPDHYDVNVIIYVHTHVPFVITVIFGVWTIWPIFCTQHFQVQFIKRMVPNFDRYT